jgi:hypothetical protein
MPRSTSVLSNESLFLLAQLGSRPACRERLRREIMVVEDVDYADTTRKLHEFNNQQQRFFVIAKLPYQIGIYTAILSGWAALPLVFHLPSAELFNEKFVWAAHPRPEEHALDTVLEVGGWTWAWMEPPLGTISFVLLCMSFVRQLRLQLGQKPFTERIKATMGHRLVAAYPHYDAHIVRRYAEHTALKDDRPEIEADDRDIQARAAAAKAAASSGATRVGELDESKAP